MKQQQHIRQSHIPVSMFVITFVVILVVAGIHMGIVQLFSIIHMNGWVETTIVMGYWCLIATGITIFSRSQMIRTYEKPMQQLAAATDAVSHGDFSVYVPTIHRPDRLDYLDVMIMDFNRMVEELGSMETLKTDFFSNVSHEMKTPLAVVSNYAQLLLMEGELSSEQREQVEGIITAAGKLSDLITNMLKLNRLEKQTILPEKAVYDVCEQLCNCILQFESRWEEKRIDMVAELEDRACIYGDPSLLELVWNNLLSNAVKFTDAGGRITVKEETVGGYVIISVTDSGCGMDQETISHMFEKFYQGDSSHATEGNGLGMALALRVLQLSGGDITVQSTSGEGSTFTVTLNAADRIGTESKEMGTDRKQIETDSKEIGTDSREMKTDRGQIETDRKKIDGREKDENE